MLNNGSLCLRFLKSVKTIGKLFNANLEMQKITKCYVCCWMLNNGSLCLRFLKSVKNYWKTV